MLFSWLLRIARRRVPQMSESERQALAAGTVWADGELFGGRPDLGKLLCQEAYPDLTEEERAFLDGPVEEVCRRVDPWRLGKEKELPEEVWELLRHQGFFGLNLPPEHGGRGFSALAQSAIFGKLASRSLGLSSVVLIPNSVGPGELLLAYGTEEQQLHYLPRLARGEEIPCFALTEPEAGSDAASLTSRGEVFRGDDDASWLRLTWEKRYITLAPVATLIGLAVRLFDPEELLGRGPEPGITLVLVPADVDGVEIGRRHDPLGVPFPNGPTRGRDVELPASAILGGAEGAGRGWPMLMEALSAGRAISLPAQSVGGAKMVARLTGAYTAVRHQFGLPISRFQGVEERLGKMAGLAYLLEAARVYTCGALATGHRPAVVSALMKYQTTELSRQLINDAMDLFGGAAICRGPRNPLAEGYLGAPIGITVEGANLLTRTLIVFGQGLMRCHPWARRQLDAVAAGDAGELRRAVLGHAGSLLRNLARALRLELSRGLLTRSPVAGPGARWAKKLAWASVRFAVAADLALLAHGGRLKRMETLAGHFADQLAWMYLATATLRRFEAEGRRVQDRPLLEWAMAEALCCTQAAYEAALASFEAPMLGALLRGPAAAWARLNRLAAPPGPPADAAAAAVLRSPGEDRDRLTSGLFLPADETSAVGRLEHALALTAAAQPLAERLHQAVRSGRLASAPPAELAAAARSAGLLEEAEADLLRRAAEARRKAVAVDEFTFEELTETLAQPLEKVQAS